MDFFSRRFCAWGGSRASVGVWNVEVLDGVKDRDEGGLFIAGESLG